MGGPNVWTRVRSQANQVGEGRAIWYFSGAGLIYIGSLQQITNTWKILPNFISPNQNHKISQCALNLHVLIPYLCNHHVTDTLLCTTSRD